MSRVRRLPSPTSLAALFVLTSFLLGSTVLPLFQNWPEKYSRHFQDAYAFTQRGCDFDVVFNATQRLLQKKEVYQQGSNFFYPPQSLLFTIPFSFLSPSQSYFIFVSLTFLILLLLYCILSRKFLPVASTQSVLYGMIFLLLSYPGIYALERGNSSLLGACLVFGVLFSILQKQFGAATILIGLAVCLKAIYLPYLFLVLTFPRRRNCFGLLLATGIGACLCTSLVYGSPKVFFDYVRASPLLVPLFQNSFGATNVGLLSSLALVFQQLGGEDLAPYLMSYESSFLVLGLLVTGVFLCKKGNELWDIVLVFGGLTYVVTLWQFLSVSYSSLPLLVLFPITDLLFRKFPGARWFAISHGIFLGLIFAPPEFRPPLLKSFRGLYYLAGFSIYLLLLKRTSWKIHPIRSELLGLSTIRIEAKRFISLF